MQDPRLSVTTLSDLSDGKIQAVFVAELIGVIREDGPRIGLDALRDLGEWIVGEYRSLKGRDTNERVGAWTALKPEQLTAPGAFSASADAWEAGVPYEFRAVVKHPLLTMYGEAKKVTLP